MQTVLITGVSRGIGRELTQMFLNEESVVYGTSTSGEVDFSHQNLHVVALDLNSPASIKACAEKLNDSGVRFDIVVNNAGALFDEDEKVLKPELLRKSLEVNLIGTADFTEQLIPFVNRGGHIVMLSSSAGSIERTGSAVSRWPSQYPAYKISKAALNMYMRTLALRMKTEDITVSAVHPGWAKTDMGGEEASISSQDAAATVYRIAISRPETGQFWYSEGKLPW